MSAIGGKADMTPMGRKVIAELVSSLANHVGHTRERECTADEG